MATDVGLNDAEAWRSVVTYRKRKQNPEQTWENRYEVPGYLDEWEEATHADVRGTYSNPGAARIQASRDANTRAADWGWMLPGKDRILTSCVVSVGIERTSLVWESFDVRDPEKGWGG